MQLRPYQSDLIGQALDRDIICIPTGTGKGAIVANIAKQYQQKGSNVVIVVPTIELKYQTIKTLESWKCPLESVTVSVWLSASELDADLWLHDECHHSASETWQKLLEKPGIHIGFSATPSRLDGKPLKGFKRVLEPYSIQWFMLHGYLCSDLSEFTIDLGYDLTDVMDDCEGQYVRLNYRAVYGRVIEEFGKVWTDDTKAIIYGVTIKHCYHIAAQFQQSGYSVAVIHSELPKAVRAKILEDFRDGRIRVLVNVAILTEGVDIPDANLLGMIRSTSSLPLFRQMIGRVLRPKPSAIILDFVGNLTRHGSVKSCTGWTEDFDRDIKRDLDNASVVLCCSSCGTVKRYGQPCPNCGAEFDKQVKPSQLPRELSGYTLTEYIVTPYQQVLNRLSKSGNDRDWVTKKLIKARALMTGFNDAILLQQFLDNRYSDRLASKIYRAIMGE